MDPLAPIPGEDPRFLDALDHVTRLAAIDRPCLIVGERGTGKELFATRLHYLSGRWDGPLVKLNCAAFSESLLDSELFGHEAGAFTGATRRHTGCFERADGGTLLLDEIASASPSVQEKLLRVVEYGELNRLGGTHPIQVDVRVVGAANVDLPAKAQAGEFRADLLDRLAFDVVTIPPLRIRHEDILPLSYGFALDMVRTLKREAFGGFSADAERTLLRHQWPGNVRELRNVIERAVYLSDGETGIIDTLVIDPFQSPWHVDAVEGESALEEQTTVLGASSNNAQSTLDFTTEVAAFESRLLNEALTSCAFNQRAAAEQLGLGYHQMRRLIGKHKLLTSRGSPQSTHSSN
jgi:psp operon transcriptional activator